MLNHDRGRSCADEHLCSAVKWCGGRVPLMDDDEPEDKAVQQREKRQEKQIRKRDKRWDGEKVDYE